VAAAFRGLDHADGLAGTVGVLTAFGAGACAAAEVMDDLAVLLSVLAAALTGFLMHNWHPARIAFGACGSLFTGFVLAAAAVLFRAGYEPGATAAVLFALTAVATGDAVLVVLSRRLAGRPLLRRGPDHLAHRLRRLGLTGPGVTVLLGAVTFATVLAGVLVDMDRLAPTGALWLAGVLLAAVGGLLCVRVYGPRRHTEFHATGTRSSAVDVHGLRDGAGYGTRTRADAGGGARATGVLTMPRTPETARGPRTRGGGPRTQGAARSAPQGVSRVAGRTSGTGRPFTPQGPRGQLEYALPPAQKSVSPQVTEVLRVREG
jgi:UDP-GlcNAc:undecaprenyl-phosphate GlcNAc-1-phosphate transferase